MRECIEMEMVIEAVLNILAIVFGMLSCTYIGRMMGEKDSWDELSKWKAEKYQEQLEKHYYMTEYNKIHWVLQSLTEEDVREITKDDWNNFIIKKKKEFPQECQ